MAADDDAERDQGREGAAPPRDAAFEDAYQPLRLAAQDAEDLKVVSALLQDAVVLSHEMAYLPTRRRFAMVLNRFRWEEPAAKERVRAGVHFDGVLSAKTRGFDPGEKDRPLNILETRFEPAEDAPAGVLRLVFSGGADVALAVEAIDGAMADMTKPWPAAAKPTHRGG